MQILEIKESTLTILNDILSNHIEELQEGLLQGFGEQNTIDKLLTEKQYIESKLNL